MVLSYSVCELMRTARQPIQAKSTQVTRCTSGDAVTGAKAWTEVQRGVPAFYCGRSSQPGVVDRPRETHSPASRMSFGVNFSHFDEPEQKVTMRILCRWNRSS
jgi:hypothetical protein